MSQKQTNKTEVNNQNFQHSLFEGSIIGAKPLFRFSDFSLAAATGQQFSSLPSAAAAAIAAQAAQQAAAAASSPVSVSGAPGKARSSMSLQLLSGR